MRSANVQDSSQVRKWCTIAVNRNLIHSVNRPLDPIPAHPEMEKSEYERIRDANIEEREQEFLRIFGYPLRRKVR